MRIAVTYLNNQIFQHFGKTKEFKVYDTMNNEIIGSQILNTNGIGHCALAQYLADNGVEVLICGGLGNGAVNALNAANVKVCAGVEGSVDEAVIKYLKGSLVYFETSNCNHHHEHHHEHSCH